jgi:MFS family permease
MELRNSVEEAKSSSTANEAVTCENANTSQDDIKPPTERKSMAFMLAFASIMASNFISIMDTVIVATALPAIAHGLKAKSNEAYWLGSGFLFAQAVSQPLYGTMSSVFGRKPCFVFAMALFTVSSVFCATARSVGWLIIARVVSCFSLLFKPGVISLEIEASVYSVRIYISWLSNQTEILE